MRRSACSVRRSRLWVGIDLGESRLHVVALVGRQGARSRVVDSRVLASTELGALSELAAGGDRVAIDAPAELSTAPHGGDESLAPKFRHARCAEIALGQAEQIWVPWTTPSDPSAMPGWMRVGFAVWAALRGTGHEPLEVYPAAVFRVLGGAVPPRKTTRAGRLARIALLEPHVELPEGIERWSHDSLDAAAAALVAQWSCVERAKPVGHGWPGCDPSSIWLPNLDNV